MGLMDEYKKQFEEEHGVKWDYTNQKLIDRYITFKRTRESFQRDYADEVHKDMKSPAKDAEGGQIEMRRIKSS